MATLHAGLGVSLGMTSVCLAAKTPGEPAALTEILGALDAPSYLWVSKLARCRNVSSSAWPMRARPAVCIETRRLKGEAAMAANKADRDDARAGGPVGMVRGGPRHVDREPGTTGPLRSWRS